MSAFVDAAVLVAILTEEEDGEVLLNRLEEYMNPITSPIALFESALGIARKRKSTAVVAFRDVQEFLDEAEISLVDITGTTQDPDGIRGAVRFLQGEHGSLLDPTDYPAATVEMQGEMASMIASNGTVVQVNNPSIIRGPIQ